jgi:hypothetical protein
MRITVQLAALRDDDSAFEVRIAECIRTAKTRTICALQLGDTFHDGDMGLLLQILDDAIRSAVGRTIGIAQTLDF